MTAEEYREEMKGWDTLTFPGLEGLYVDKDVCAFLHTFSGYVPEMVPQFIGGLKQAADAMQVKRIDRAFFLGFTERLPVPEAVRKSLPDMI